MILNLIGNAIKGIFGIVDKAVTDKDKANELKAEIQKEMSSLSTKITEAQRDIIVADAKGNWLQRSWRPILSLAFGFIIFNSKFISLWLKPFITNLPDFTISPAEWTFYMAFLTAYGVGRSYEKSKNKEK